MSTEEILYAEVSRRLEAVGLPSDHDATHKLISEARGKAEWLMLSVAQTLLADKCNEECSCPAVALVFGDIAARISDSGCSQW